MPNRLKKSMKRLAAAVCITLSCVMQTAAQEFLPVSEVQEGMHGYAKTVVHGTKICLLYTSPSPRDRQKSRMPSSA